MEKKFLSKSTVGLVKGLVVRAVEELTGLRDDNISVIPFSKSGEFDYQSVFAPKIYPQLEKKDPEFKARFPTQEALVEAIQKRISEDKKLIQSTKVIDKVFLLILVGDEYLEEQMNGLLKNGAEVERDENPQHIVVDFSSPNIAKEMHVGHLRSTILGESICRVLEAKGHKVKRMNHLGDWGTQFGMLIAHMQDSFPEYLTTMPNLKDLETFYKQSKKRFDEDAAFKERAQKLVVKLQSGDEDCLKAWRILCDVSRSFFNMIYKRLNITIEEFGESFYNPMIPGVLNILKEKNLTTMDKGALCMFIPKKKLPLMVVKSDGGYNYDTTDMAAAWYRLTQLKADRVIILTDVGQYPHFELIFEGAKLAGWHVPPKTRMDHMGFGLVTGADGQKIKTRSGETAKLMDLIDEATDRARKELQSREEAEQEAEEKKNEEKKAEEAEDAQAKKKEFDAQKKTQLSEEEFDKASEVLGVAAIKYFDMRQNRIQNYKFDYDQMLSQKGDTAVYLMYAFIRLSSILRKGGVSEEELRATPFKFTHPQERVIARHLVRFNEVIEMIVDQLTLNKLCEYLYALSCKIAESYGQYKILKNDDTVQRLKLILISRDMMATCFNLLNIKTIDRI